MNFNTRLEWVPQNLGVCFKGGEWYLVWYWDNSKLFEDSNKGGVKIGDGCLCSGVFWGDILHGLEICEETSLSKCPRWGGSEARMT